MTNINDTVFINSIDEFLLLKASFKRGDRFSFKCVACGEQVVSEYRSLLKKTSLLCKGCTIKEKKQHEDLAATAEKRKQTCLKRFGKETSFPKRNSNEAYAKAKEAREKTCLEKYGSISCFGNSDIRKKIDKTMDERYGGHSSKCDSVKEKQRKTFLERYGGYTLQVEELRNKCFSARQRIYYEDERFDSYWELAYFLWLKEKNIEFDYHPAALKYFTNDGKEHKYYPDFFLTKENRYVEIKGPAFFNEKGEPYNKLSKKYWWEKYNYMLDNKIEIIKDIQPYIDDLKIMRGELPIPLSFTK